MQASTRSRNAGAECGCTAQLGSEKQQMARNSRLVAAAATTSLGNRCRCVRVGREAVP